MSLEISKDGKEGVLKDVVLGYVSMQRPARTQKEGEAQKYAAEAFLSTETQKEFKKMFPKTSLRMIPNEEVKERFKIDPPFPEQSVQYVVSIRQGATIKKDNPEKGVRKGDLVPHDWPSRPKVYEPNGDVAVDITHTKGVGVGSKGNVSFAIRTDDYGNNPDLKGVLVTELKEYSSKPKTDILGMPIARTERSEGSNESQSQPAQSRPATPRSNEPEDNSWADAF
jgi:hypothetical protein